jgi:Ca2+-transporting ATPase
MTIGTILVFSYEYNYALELGLIPSEALAKSQTTAVTFIVMFQIFYLLNCRSLKDSIAKIGFFSNKIIFWGITAIIFLQALFIYTPFMQKVFGTASLDVREIAITLLTGSIIFFVIDIEKWIVRRLSSNKNQKNYGKKTH